MEGSTLLQNAIYAADVKTACDACPALSALAGRAVLLTGATGLIGSAVADMLMAFNETAAEPVCVYAAGRSVRRLEKRFGPASDVLRFVEYDAGKPLAFREKVDYIIHAASNASPELYVSQPVETMTANFAGLRELLEYARENAVRRVLYVSSSEVYGQKQTADPFREDDYGFVDILNVRASYAMSKRAAETLLRAYAGEYGVDGTSVRPGHIYGPTATESDQRISSVFALRAARGQELVMKSAGTQMRSYCHCLDCASAILTVLVKGEPGGAYNISNRYSLITIRQMAEILAEKGGVTLRTDMPTAAEKAAFNPMDNSTLNAEKLEALGWRGCFDARTGLGHTVDILAAVYGKGAAK